MSWKHEARRLSSNQDYDFSFDQDEKILNKSLFRKFYLFHFGSTSEIYVVISLSDISDV